MHKLWYYLIDANTKEATRCSANIEAIVDYNIVIHEPVPSHEFDAMTATPWDTVKQNKISLAFIKGASRVSGLHI